MEQLTLYILYQFKPPNNYRILVFRLCNRGNHLKQFYISYLYISRTSGAAEYRALESDSPMQHNVHLIHHEAENRKKPKLPRISDAFHSYN